MGLPKQTPDQQAGERTGDVNAAPKLEAGSARSPRHLIVLFAIAGLCIWAATQAVQRPVVREEAAKAAVWSDLRIDINTASEAEFRLLPGIGPRLAERIVDDREQAGAFAAVDELNRVHGIGQTTIERLRPYVTARSSGTVNAAPASAVSSHD